VLNQCEHFADKEGGSIFRDFVRTSFMDGPLLEFRKIIFSKYEFGKRSEFLVCSSECCSNF